MNVTRLKTRPPIFPCDRCLAVRPLSRHGTDWLCAPCNPDHAGCDQLARSGLDRAPTWTCDHHFTYRRPAREQP